MLLSPTHSEVRAMRQSLRKHFVASFAFFVLGQAALPLAASTGAGAAADASGTVPVTVRVENYSGASGRLIKSAQVHAAKIFRGAGVEIRWVDCRVVSSGKAENPACLTPNGPADLSVLIVPRSQTMNFPLNPGVVGIAQLPPAGGFGYMAYVFYQRLEELCGHEFPKAPVLGHMIAHELGHLLLGSNTHSRSGIIHVPWRSWELQRACEFGMRFTKQQSDRIRANVLRRLKLLQSAESPHVGDRP